MTINDVISKLILLPESCPLLANTDNEAESSSFVYLFGNSNGEPCIFSSDEKPIPGLKTVGSLITELELWKSESANYKPMANLLLGIVHNYRDESYDYRYFSLDVVSCNKGNVMLISNSQEIESKREHFDAVSI